MNIWITGDCHGNFKRFSRKGRAKFGLKDNDFVIVTGDFGLLWCDDKEFHYNLDWMSRLPITILWVAGNHENYNMLEAYPIEDWNGGKVRHIIRNKIIYLERGQIFTIEGKTFFTLGGASSQDIEDGILDRGAYDFDIKLKFLKRNKLKRYRILNESWWAQELPTEQELNDALIKLQEYNDKVDYIITHCASSNLEENLGLKNHDRLNDFLNYIDKFVTFNHWYLGHYHQDVTLEDEKHTILYKQFRRLI